jgi:protein-S-isoprenylcysteine O-methyltransferase Ste14
LKRLALSISLLPLVLFVLYIYLSVFEAICISYGGAWLGVFEGCDILIDEGFYAMHISPMYFFVFIVLFLVLMVASNLFLKKSLVCLNYFFCLM